MKLFRHDNSVFFIPTITLEMEKAYEDNTLFGLSLCFSWLDWTLWVTIYES